MLGSVPCQTVSADSMGHSLLGSIPRPRWLPEQSSYLFLLLWQLSMDLGGKTKGEGWDRAEWQSTCLVYTRPSTESKATWGGGRERAGKPVFIFFCLWNLIMYILKIRPGGNDRRQGKNWNVICWFVFLIPETPRPTTQRSNLWVGFVIQAQVKWETGGWRDGLVVRSTCCPCLRAELPEPKLSGSQLPVIPSLQQHRALGL